MAFNRVRHQAISISTASTNSAKSASEAARMCGRPLSWRVGDIEEHDGSPIRREGRLGACDERQDLGGVFGCTIELARLDHRIFSQDPDELEYLGSTAWRKGPYLVVCGGHVEQHEGEECPCAPVRCAELGGASRCERSCLLVRGDWGECPSSHSAVVPIYEDVPTAD